MKAASLIATLALTQARDYNQTITNSSFATNSTRPCEDDPNCYDSYESKLGLLNATSTSLNGTFGMAWNATSWDGFQEEEHPAGMVEGWNSPSNYSYSYLPGGPDNTSYSYSGSYNGSYSSYSYSPSYSSYRSPSSYYSYYSPSYNYYSYSGYSYYEPSSYSYYSSSPSYYYGSYSPNNATNSSSYYGSYSYSYGSYSPNNTYNYSYSYSPSYSNSSMDGGCNETISNSSSSYYPSSYYGGSYSSWNGSYSPSYSYSYSFSPSSYSWNQSYSPSYSYYSPSSYSYNSYSYDSYSYDNYNSYSYNYSSPSYNYYSPSYSYYSPSSYSYMNNTYYSPSSYGYSSWNGSYSPSYYNSYSSYHSYSPSYSNYSGDYNSSGSYWNSSGSVTHSRPFMTYRSAYFRDFYDQFVTAKHVLFCSERAHCQPFVNDARQFKQNTFGYSSSSEISDEFECGMVVFTEAGNYDKEFQKASVCIPSDFCGDSYHVDNVLISTYCGHSAQIHLQRASSSAVAWVSSILGTVIVLLVVYVLYLKCRGSKPTFAVQTPPSADLECPSPPPAPVVMGETVSPMWKGANMQEPVGYATLGGQTPAQATPISNK